MATTINMETSIWSTRTVGAYIVNGTSGNDNITFRISSRATFNPDTDASVIYGNDGVDVVNAGPTNDTLWGGAGNDILQGNDGNDKIHGEAGDDFLDGGNGIDTLYGGPGNNTLMGGSGDDLLHGSAYLEGTTIQQAVGNDLVVGGAGNDTLYGSLGNDEVQGGVGDDILLGQDNDDKLYGGANNDILDGGAGNDTVDGGDGADTVSYVTASAGVTVDLAVTTAQNTVGAGTDTLSASESLIGSNSNDVLSGTDSANAIEGRAGTDKLYGRDGNDFLFGGDGNLDELYGDAGDDYLDGGAGNQDYAVGGTGNDTLVTSAGLQDFLIGAEGNDIFEVWGGGLVSGASFTVPTAGNHQIYGGPDQDTFNIAAGLSRIFDWEDGEDIAVDYLQLTGSLAPAVAAISAENTWVVRLLGVNGSALKSSTFVYTDVPTTSPQADAVAAVVDDIMEWNPPTV